MLNNLFSKKIKNNYFNDRYLQQIRLPYQLKYIDSGNAGIVTINFFSPNWKPWQA